MIPAAVDNFVNTVFKFKKIWGVSIVENEYNSFEISVSLLELKKGIVTTKENLFFYDLNELSKVDFTSIPVVMSYDGTEVLSKQIESGDSVSLEKEFHLSNLDDFYYYISKTENGFFGSVVRRNDFNERIANIFNSNVISFLLGPFGINDILSYIEEEMEYLSIYPYTFQIENNEIQDFNIESEKVINNKVVKIGGQEIEQREVISYSNALSCFLNNSISRVYVDSNIKQNWLNYKYKIFSSIILFYGMPLLFVVLLGNFFVLHTKMEKHNKSVQNYAMHQKELEMLEKLTKEFDRKKRIVSCLNADDNGFVSFYADRIASSLTKNVKLTSLEINPLQGKKGLYTSNEMIFNTNEIKINGLCSSSQFLNDWLSKLKEEKYVGEIKNQSYEFDNYENMGRFVIDLIVVSP